MGNRLERQPSMNQSLFFITKWQSTHIASSFFPAPLLSSYNLHYIAYFYQKMAQQPSKSISSFIPKLKQTPLPSFKNQEFQEIGFSSLLRISEPQSATPSLGSKSNTSWHASQTPSITSLRRNENGKGDRLKLKDYLHLNSIEKKNKKSSSTSKSELEQTSSVQLRKNPSAMSSTQGGKSMQSTMLSEPNIPVPIADPTQILKEDILKRIQMQMGELNDLARYVRQGFKVHQSENRAQLMLFNLLNSVVNSSKSYQHIGDQISQYEKGEEGSKQKGQNYYWEESRRSLESPAKMLKKGLELTFSLAQFLQARK